MAQAVTLQDALRVVPEFDGFCTPLSTFLEGCDEAKAMINAAAEPNLVKLIRCKLKGEARSAIYGQVFDTIDAFKEYIKNIYTSAKTIPQLLREISNEFQRDDESVNSYAIRMKNLQMKILEAKRLDSNGRVTQTFTESLAKATRECFKTSLRPEIQMKLHLDGSEDIIDIVKQAIKYEKMLVIQRALRSLGP